jgi:radical SAM protein with 4Fe4S-binding SPASM domain
MPNHINFAITYRCNAKCKHCSINANYISNGKQYNEMDKEEIFGTIEQLADIGLMFLGITGGEAILHPNIFEIIKFSKEKDLFVSIASNGLAINPKIINKLCDCKLDGILISIDHVDAKIHNKIRGIDGLYDNAINAIKMCVENGLYTTVGMTPMKINVDSFYDLVELAKNLGANAVNISSFIPTGRGEKKDDLTAREWKEFTQNVIKATKLYKGKIDIHFHDPRLNILNKGTSTFVGDISGCLAGYTHCYILPDGTVTPCVMLPKIIGNVRNKHIKDILINYQKEEDFFNRSKIKGKCGTCKFKLKCGGCRAVAYAYTSDDHEEDSRCWFIT